jgi:hypothetical protein
VKSEKRSRRYFSAYAAACVSAFGELRCHSDSSEWREVVPPSVGSMSPKREIAPSRTARVGIWSVARHFAL